MKQLVFTLVILLFSTALQAYDLPTGSKVLYKSERQYERYGMHWHQFIVYEHSRNIFLVRLQRFSGARDLSTDDESLAHNAEYVKAPLSKKQVRQLSQMTKNARFIEKIQAFKTEQQAFGKALKEEAELNRIKNMVITPRGDTIYKLSPRVEKMHYHSPALWQIDVEWEGTATGIHSFGRFHNDDDIPSTWTQKTLPARDTLLKTIDDINLTLDKWAFDYKLKHLDTDELRSYQYQVSGGMMRKVRSDGKMVRQGSNIELRNNGGQWYVCGYVGEQEDTVRVDNAVAEKVEKMLKALDYAAMDPTPDKGEKVLKATVDDGISWSLKAYYYNKEATQIYATFGETFVEPKRFAKAYNKLMKDIDIINDYLWAFLKLLPSNNRK